MVKKPGRKSGPISSTLGSISWDKRIERLEIALRELPNADKLRPQSIADVACDLASMNGQVHRTSLTSENTPDMPAIVRKLINIARKPEKDGPASRVATQRELAKIGFAAVELIDALNLAHDTARLKLNLRPEYLEMLHIILSCVAVNCDLVDLSDVPASFSKGPPKKERASEIADRVAFHFHWITGKLPTVITPSEGGKSGGHFLDLLAVVFEVTSTDAQVEYQGRMAIQRRKKAMEIMAR